MNQTNNAPVAPTASRRSLRVTLMLLLCFLLLLLAGIALDEPARVLEQARAVCLSCIGIG